MPVIITNVSEHDDIFGLNDYIVSINSKAVATFQHERLGLRHQFGADVRLRHPLSQAESARKRGQAMTPEREGKSWIVKALVVGAIIIAMVVWEAIRR